MIVEGWHVDGYGVHRDHGVEGLGAGACVVYGANETGKSTLLSFLRFVLFGPAGAAPLPALRGGHPGGRVFLRATAPAEGVWTVDRQAGRRPPTILDPDGQPAGPDALTRLLGGVDAGLFGAVFAFSLAELSRFESLTGSAVRDQIFSAGITGAGVTASQARQRLEAARSSLLRPRTTRARINGLLADLRGVRGQLDAAERTAGTHGELLREEAEAERSAARLAGELERLRGEERLLETLQQLWEPWNRWRQARAELASMPPGHAGSREEMAQARRNRDVAAQRLEDLARTHDETDRTRGAIALDPALETVAARVSACAAGLGAQRARLRQLTDLAARLHELEARSAGRLADLGAGWTADRVRAFDLPATASDEAQALRQRVEDETGAAERARARSEDAAAEARLAAEEAAGLRAAAASLADCPAREEIDAQREQIDAIERRLPWIRSAPAWLALLLGLSFALAAFGTTLPGPAGWSALAVGALAALAALATLGRSWLGERRHLLAAAAELDIGGRLQARGLDDARRRLRLAAEEARRREGAETRLRAAQEEAERAARNRDDLQARAEEAHRRSAAALADWDAWKAHRGLPGGLTPQGFATFAAALRAARESEADLREAARQAEELRTAAASWRQEAGGLLAETGRSDPADDGALLQAIDGLAADAAAAAEARRSHEGLGRRIGEIDLDVASARAAFEQAVTAHGRILATAGASDDAEYDAAALAAETRERKEAEVRHLWEGIAAQLGDAAYGRRVRRRLEDGGPAEWAAERLSVDERLRQVAAERDGAIEVRTRAGQRRREIEESADIPALAGRERALLDELASAVGDWRRLRLAEELLDSTLGRFIRDRQPEVLGFASDAFVAVTGGRYRRVVQDAAAVHTLAVVDASGNRIEPGQLSRGTEEQLYLSLRLGLAESFARRAAALPLVLDDALVNFDPERAAAMLQAFSGYLSAGDRQVLLFTCHPEIRDLVLRVFPRCPVVELAAAEPAEAPGREAAAASENGGRASRG